MRPSELEGHKDDAKTSRPGPLDPLRAGLRISRLDPAFRLALCDQLRTGRPIQDGSGRASWCYGAAGVARAQQLAAIASRDDARQTAAEYALAACLSRPQLDRLTDIGICHGLAGLYQTAYRAAADTASPAIAQRLPDLAALLYGREHRDDDNGFLTGHTGVALTRETIRTGQPPHTRWDTCLLIA